MVAAPDLGPPIVGPDWLAEHYDQVTVADVRWYLDGRSGYDAYLVQHLPGAIFVDLDRYLSGPPSANAGRHPLPTPAVFAAGLSSLGIDDGAPVVGYDDDGGRTAARLVWLLRATGHAASLLDGGAGAWPGPFESAHEGEQSTSQRSSVQGGVFPASRSPASPWPARPWPASRLATSEEVASATVVLDARAPERYRGEVEPIDARPGHIPGARNAPTAGNLDGHGRFKPREELRAWYEGLGVAPGNPPSCTAGQASLRATTCWRWSGRGWRAGACTRAPGLNGARTRPSRSRLVDNGTS